MWPRCAKLLALFSWLIIYTHTRVAFVAIRRHVSRSELMESIQVGPKSLSVFKVAPKTAVSSASGSEGSCFRVFSSVSGSEDSCFQMFSNASGSADSCFRMFSSTVAPKTAVFESSSGPSPKLSHELSGLRVMQT